MLKIINKSNWITGSLIFFMPVLLIIFLGSQMAYSQVNRRFEAYREIPEITQVADLESLPAGQIVMLRGQLSQDTPPGNLVETAADLIVYQERPADGREVRFQEEFYLIFPEFTVALADGTVAIQPSLTRELIIQHEAHAIPYTDRMHTGFRSGDTVTVQGEWPAQAGSSPTLIDVTGISGLTKEDLLAEWQQAFQRVRWARDGLGFLTLLSLILLIVQWRRTKRNNTPGETELWQSQKTESVPTTSP